MAASLGSLFLWESVTMSQPTIQPSIHKRIGRVMNSCPPQQPHLGASSSSAATQASSGRSELKGAISTRPTVASARRARPRARRWSRRKRQRLTSRSSFAKRLRKVMRQSREGVVIGPHFHSPKTRSRSPRMNLKTSSVRVASLFGRFTVLAVSSPMARLAVRTVTVAVTLARRFVRQ